MFKRLRKYQNQLNTMDVIKIIAVFSMIIDHAGVYMFHKHMAWRTLGRVAAPLFFFCVGYNGAIPKRYMQLQINTWQKWFIPPLNLIMFGLIFSYTSYIINKHFELDILLNIFLIKLSFEYFSPKQWSNLKLIIISILFLMLNFYFRNFIEYGLLGIVYAIGAQALCAGRRRLAILVFFFTVIGQFAYYWHDASGYYLLLISVALFVWTLLSCFRMKTIKVPFIMKNILLFFSRYTLEIYFIHLLLLRLYAIIRFS